MSGNGSCQQLQLDRISDHRLWPTRLSTARRCQMLRKCQAVDGQHDKGQVVAEIVVCLAASASCMLKASFVLFEDGTYAIVLFACWPPWNSNCSISYASSGRKLSCFGHVYRHDLLLKLYYRERWKIVVAQEDHMSCRWQQHWADRPVTVVDAAHCRRRK